MWAALLGSLPGAAPADMLIGPTAVQVPDGAALEAAGARIGTVTVRVRQIFDTHDPREDAALFRLANVLHVETRETTVRAQLLFAPGDRYSRRVVAETERHLRRLRYVQEPEIRIVGVHDGAVDLEVSVRDVWTMNPGVSFGRSGGANSSGIEFEDLNVLGLGKRLDVELESNVDRDTRTIRWVDPGVLGTRWRTELGFTEGDDGSGYRLVLDRPFFALDARWSAGLAVERDESFDHRYALGRMADGFERDHRFAEAYLGWSAGFDGRWTRRWSAGLRYEASLFGPAVVAGGDVAGAADAPLSPFEAPQDRKLVYPYLRYEAIEDDFAIVRNYDQIARAEDLAFGRHYILELGAAASAFGARRDAVVFAAEASRGLRLGEDGALLLSAGADGRLENGAAIDTRLSAGARYYRRTSPRTLLFAAFQGDFGHVLDADHDLLLGGDNGLRGYPLRYQSGSRRALLTIEERLYTNWSLWRLAHVGGAAFVDVGRTWGESAIDAPQRGLLGDIGLGLRLGTTRSGLGNVLHLDVAWPLQTDPSIRSVQFLVQTKHSF